MSDFLVQQSDKYINPDGSSNKPYGTKLGDQYVMDWKQSSILEGYGFMAKVGSLSTPVVGGGDGTVVDLDQPEFGMIIPDGKTIVPIRLSVQLLAPLLAADDDEIEALAFVDTTAATVAAALDGTWANTITPVNMRMAATNRNASTCTVKSVCSADTTDPTESMDLDHLILHGDVQGTPANAFFQKAEMLYEPINPPFIVGPASLFVYWGGTVATSGFMQFTWLERASADWA